MEELNIYQKLAKIGESVKILKKSKRGYNYTYVPEEDILARIQGKMDELHVSLIPSIVPGTASTVPRDYKKTKTVTGGKILDVQVNEAVVSGEMMFMWVDNDNPDSCIKVPWFFTGQQEDASQAFGSALTYASRYFKLQFFQIATTDDPDAIIAKKKEAEQAEKKKITEEIKEQISNFGGEFLSQYEKDSKEYNTARDTIYAITKKHSSNTDYRKITDPRVAAAVLEELTQTLKRQGDK
jgi:hypothetical protein